MSSKEEPCSTSLNVVKKRSLTIHGFTFNDSFDQGIALIITVLQIVRIPNLKVMIPP